MTDLHGQPSVLDYLRVIWRARWLILALAVIAPAVALGVARLLPKVYTAKATILPPKEAAPQSFSMSLGALLLGSGGGREGAGLALPGAAMLGLPSLTSNQDAYIALLKSRTLKEEVLGELSRAWGPSVRGMVVSVQPDTKEKGMIGLTAEATDPKLAADVANSYFEALDRLLERYADRSVRQQEKFYAGQLERGAREIETAEQELLKFQAENRVLAVDPSTRGAVESVGMLRGFIMALEMQREILRMRFTDQHPQVLEIDKQISELKRQYSRNLFGAAMDLPPESPTARGLRKEFFVPAEKLTPVQFAFLKLYRNLKVQEAFYTAALQGLQQLKVSDGYYHPRVEVLDSAIPPSTHSRPNIPLISGVAAGSALVVGILLAFFLEYLARVRAQERQARARAARPKRPEGSGFPGPPGEEIPLGLGRGTLAGGGE